jgi:HK97 family phage major capsid protein
MSIQELREQRAAKAQALHLHASKENWNADADQPIYDAGFKELDDLDARIKRISDSNERLANEALEGMVLEAADRTTRNKGANTKLFKKWLKDGDKGLTAEDWQTIRNTTSTTTGSEGGFTVQTDVATTLLDALKYFGAMRQVATILRTDAGNAMSFPTSDGTSETGEWIAENVTATAADPVFGTKSLPVFKASSKVVAIPFELLQDSQVDIEGFVNMRLATRLGRVTNTGYTVGTGTGQPTGIITAATTGVTAATGNTLTTNYDDLVNLVHSVDAAYRNANCRFMMNDLSIRQIRKIKDAQNRPIFVPGWETLVPGAAASQPDTLMGYPIVTNNDIAVMAANAKSIAFGDFGYYYIRDAMGVTMFRFTDSAYTKLGQVGFLAWMRSGGNLIDVGGAVKLHVNSAT